MKDLANPDEITSFLTPQDSQISEHLCPSARCEEGAILVGLVSEHGVVGYITPQMKVDSDFVHRAHQGRAPEKRFRFSQPCIESGCIQWTGNRCGLIDRALQATENEEGSPTTLVRALPKCSIRSKCRWFAQLGLRACAVCPLIITDVE